MPDFYANRAHHTNDAHLPYTYPQHLREAVADLPNGPGVYVFHGDEEGLPLYIGKSIHIRTRVLSHLRNPDEAKLLRQTRRITALRTAGEMGALLLEAQMIKQQQPLFNHQLRRNRQLCTVRLNAQGQPEVVHARDVDFAHTPALYGLFVSQRAAQDFLRNLADAQRLCYGHLGLEKPTRARACFRAMLKQCAGVCAGQESTQAHQQRLFDALRTLQLQCWPYDGAVGLIETHDEEGWPRLHQIHVVHNWCYLGSVPDENSARDLSLSQRLAPAFDADGYKILCKPMLQGTVRVVRLG
jgi:excinuclease Cho